LRTSWTLRQDGSTTAAIADRVTFNAHIVETGTDSFRFKKTQEKHGKS
jgi:hypothetical protein